MRTLTESERIATWAAEASAKATRNGSRTQHRTPQPQSDAADTSAIPDLSLFSGAVTLKFKKGSRGKVDIHAIGKDGLIHQDAIAFASDGQRTRFLKKIAKKLALS